MKENLKNEIDQNNKRINQCLYLIHELKLGDFKEKVGRIGLIGGMYYLPVLGVLLFLNIPSSILPPMTLISSFGLGAISNAILENKANCKRRFKNVSKSKNESERLEEILRLEMEIERLKTKNEILESTHKKIIEFNNINESINNRRYFDNKRKYHIIDCDDSLNKEELISRINFLEYDIERKLKKLDYCVDDDIIKDNKNKACDNQNSIFHSMICSTIPAMLSVLSIITYTIKPLSAPSLIPAYTALGSMAATFIGSMIYFNKNKKDKLNAINRIISERDICEESHIPFQGDKLKENIISLYFMLYDYKNKLQKIESCKNNKSVSVKELSEDYTLDDTPNNQMKLTLK